MSDRGAKRARSNDWPELFEITNLTKMIFAYIPKLQVKQWVRKSSGTLQREICSWMLKADIDYEIHNAIICVDNAQCVQYLPSPMRPREWYRILTHPVPNLLRTMLGTAPLHDLVSQFAYQTDIPLCNVQALMTHPQWTQQMTQQITCDGIKMQAREWLPWLLSLPSDPCEIGLKLGCEFDLHFWNVIQPFVVSGKLTMQTTPTQYLAEMPLVAFRMVPLSVYEHRIRELCNASIKRCNWSLGNHLWNPDFMPDLSTELECYIDTHIDPCYGLGLVDSDRCIHVFDVFEQHDSVTCLNSALQFVAEQAILDDLPQTLGNAIRIWTLTYLSNHPFNDLAWLFERVCISGHFYLVDAIWKFCQEHFEQQSHKLKAKLIQCQYCANRKLLEFAFPMIQDEMRQDVLSWLRAVYYNKNVVLWKFLVENQIVSELYTTSFPWSEHNEMPFMSNFGTKLLSLLKMVLDMPQMCTQKNFDWFYRKASEECNKEVLQCLNTKNVRISQHIIVQHMLACCIFELTNIISQLKFESDADVYPWYSIAGALHHTTPLEALWRIAPLSSPIRLLQESDISRETCVFLLEKHAITAQTMVETLQNKHQPNELLLESIQAQTYCDADEVLYI